MTADYKFEYKFAWIPTFIRNNKSHGDQHWIWLKRYTRVKRFNYILGRQKTFDTYLGWDK